MERKSLPHFSASLGQLYLSIWVLSAHIFIATNGCQFYPLGEFMRFIRIPEDLKIGDLVMNIEVHQRQNISLESVDKNDDARYFKLHELNHEMVELRLAKTLENLVDNESPQSILKFRMVCFSEESHENTPVYHSITIYLEDVNNHPPEFINAPYKIQIDELTPVGLTIFRGINAIDLDKPNTANSDIYFSILDGNEDEKFSLDNGKPAALILRRSLDFDAGDHEFRLVIMAMDRGQKPLSSTTLMMITVTDADDLHPIFSSSIYRTHLTEFFPYTNASIHQPVSFPIPIRAYDQDLSINATLEYDIVSGNELKYFEMNSNNGTIFLIREIDRESLPSNSFDMQIRARQIDNPTKFGLSKVLIEVSDINDNKPVFELATYEIAIQENLPNGFSVVQVYASDLDINQNAEFLYKLEDSTGPFAINSKTGWLTVKDQSQLDREKVDLLKLVIFAEEKVPNVAGNKRSQCIVAITLLDSNDNSPTFRPSNLYKFQITIESEIGAVIGKVSADDPDLLGNGEVQYEIQKPNSSNEEIPFQVDEKSGYIFLLERPLPKLQYTILIQASDQPLNPSEKRFSLAVVQIDVVKADSSHSPEFIGSPYQFWVGNEVGVGTSVGQVKVKDFDPKFTVYDLLHSYYEGVPFAIEERTGIIAVVDELVKYPRHHYDFEAYVTDSRHTLTTNVSIHIVDPVNAVTESSQEPIELNVKENVAGGVIGNLRTILNSPIRETRAMEFLLANGRDKFAISSDGTIYTLKSLDREEHARHLLTVIAQTRGIIQGQGIYQLYVNVLDENDNPPQFDRQQYEGHVRENVNPGTPVQLEHPIKVIDLDEGKNAEYKIELKGVGADKFRIDPSNGKIYVGNTNLDREEKQMFILDLIAKDSQNLSTQAKLQIMIADINDNAPQFIHKIILDSPEMDDSSDRPRELLRAGSSQPISVEVSNTEPILIPETISVGSVVARVSAADRDAGDNSRVFYRIVSENSNETGRKLPYLTDKQYLFSRNKDKHFTIDRITGKISVSKPLKPETVYALNISASDRGGLRSYTGIKVHVYDVNNNLPLWNQFFYKFEILEGTYAQGEIGAISATDKDLGKNGLVTYKLEWKESDKNSEHLPFGINQTSGVIYVEGEIDREKKSQYLLQGIATDMGTTPMSANVDVEIKVLDKNEAPPTFYNFMSTTNVNGQVIPVYRTSIQDNITSGSAVIQLHANDTDDPLLGNGVVLFHLTNNHKVFHIDSKNATIFTSTKLDYDTQNQYNVTVIASDLGRPALSSTAFVLIRLADSKMSGIERHDRVFEHDVYTFQVPHTSTLPMFIAKINVTEKHKKLRTEFELIGSESALSKLRIEPSTGDVYMVKNLSPNRTYEFVIRGYNSRHTKAFDTRQGNQISDRSLEPNEAILRVRLMAEPIKLTTKPPSPPIIKKPTQTTPRSKFNFSEPIVITKGPRLVHGIASTKRPPNNSTDLGRKNKASQKSSNLFAGEIAILVLSSVILLGGLIAAISVSCVKRNSYRRPRRSAIPVEVHLQKQPTRIVSNISTNRPLIFPMALPGHDGIFSEEHSESTSDSYTDSADIFREGHQHHNESHVLQSNGYSICPDCRKLRKPGFRETRGLGRNIIDRGPLKQVVRTFGPREISLQSNTNDSGIDGSDGQCNCCQSHNFSSDSSGRSLFVEQYEDSLMPSIINPKSKSFKRRPPPPNKKINKLSSSYSNSGGAMNINPSAISSRRSDRMFI